MTGDNAILQHSKVYNLGIIQFVGIIKCCDQSGDRVSKNEKIYHHFITKK